MSHWLKLLIGLALALLIGWLSNGPLGRGAAYADLLQQRADFVLRISEVPNVQARIARAPSNSSVCSAKRRRPLRGWSADRPGRRRWRSHRR